MFPNSPRLTAGEVSKLEEHVKAIYSNDNVARTAALKLLKSVQDWIESAHFYRHEQGQEEPTQPPLDLTIHIVSVGASFIRWLAELDAKRFLT
jgi:hypothetical protein